MLDETFVLRRAFFAASKKFLIALRVDVALGASDGRALGRSPVARAGFSDLMFARGDRVHTPGLALLDTLRIKFGRIDSSEAPNTANDRADQLALSAGMRGRVVLAKTIGARLAPLMD